MSVVSRIAGRRDGIDTGEPIGNSCMFVDGSSCNMTRTAGSSTDNKKVTLSVWFKRASLTGNTQSLYSCYFDANNYAYISIDSNNQLNVRSQYSGVTHGNYTFASVLRDMSAWYHLVVVIDATEAASADRVKVWLNGASLTPTVSTAWTNSTSHQLHQNTVTHYIGSWTSGDYFDGYLAEMYVVDGVAHAATDFGRLNAEGHWVPKAVSGLTYGNNGFYLDFADSGDLGDDESGNTNDWTENNFGTDHQFQDTPTNNYPIWFASNNSTSTTYTEGATEVNVIGSTREATLTQLVPPTGKWYIEIEWNGGTTSINTSIIIKDLLRDPYRQGSSYEFKIGSQGTISVDRCTVDSDSFTSLESAGTNVGFEFDRDAGVVYLYQDGSAAGQVSGLGDGWLSINVYGEGAGSNNQGWKVNSGSRGFDHTPSAGYMALCTENLSGPDDAPIPKGSDYFDVLTYEGDGTEPQAIAGLDFQPDMVWIKNRDATDNHQLFDSVRGATESLQPNGNNAESTNDDTLESFDSGGFTVGDDEVVNTNNESYVAWCWKEAVEAGLDIVTYTGDGAASKTIAHGLNAVPECIIVKNRDQTDSWVVYFGNQMNNSGVYITDPETDVLTLDTNNTASDNNIYWNDTAPDASEFTVGSADHVNASGEDYVAYVFAEIPGFFKQFCYRGNGDSNGPFVWTGGRPRMVLIKTNYNGAAASWVLVDSERRQYNPINAVLYPDVDNAEDTSAVCDFLSNGFKLRNSSNNINGNNDEYVGIALMEHPFKYARAF